MLLILTALVLLSLTSSLTSHQYHFRNIRNNWTGAQKFFCEKNTDLAVKNEHEMKSLFKTIIDVSYGVYIGLYRSEVFTRPWFLPDSSSNRDIIQNGTNEQQDKDNKWGCAAMQNNGMIFNDKCDSQKQFMCFNATDSNKYILITNKTNWRKAQEYCRTFHTDLANAGSSGMYLMKIFKYNSTWQELWIGFKDWSVSDQSDSSFYSWSFNPLKHISSSHNCTAVMVNTRWGNIQCNVTLFFICYGDLKQTTESATPGPATTEYRPTQNTTEGENTNSQTTQILPTGTEQDNPKDNLILVNERLTWTEAASYCRKHHVDLISIRSEELQNKAARKAIQASTSHVWMGLRYTCTFSFWFWIKNRELGCYQNWASGHGPHAFEECGLSGAMESTGGHHWVGKPESDRLNFICHTCAG